MSGSAASRLVLLVSLAFFGTLAVAQNVKMKIGHIGAVGAMPNSDKILEISRKELWKEGVLANDFDVEIISQNGCGEAFEGVAVGADMYHIQKVRAFIGPYCNTELDAVAKMATFWNVPIIGYMASSNTFANKTLYKTLARVSLRTTNSLAEACAALLKHFGWKKVAIVTNSGALAFERTSAFEEVFHNRGIVIIKKIMFDETADARSMQASGLMEELNNSARIIICMFSSTRELSKEFMQAAYAVKMNGHDFVYILPWLQSESKDASPWIGQDGQMLQNIKDHYANTIILDDVNGFDDSMLVPFRERIESNGLSLRDLEMSNIYGYIHLYDSLKLYALAARAAMADSPNRTAALSDGRQIWQHMRRLKFNGSKKR